MPRIDSERRVLRVVARLNVGGPAKQIIALGRGLEARGVRHLLAVGRPGPAEGDLTGAAVAAGLEVEVVPGLGREPAPLADLGALARLVRVVRAFRPHVVHTHTAKAGALGRIAAALAGVKVRVHTFHGHVFSGYFGRATTAAVVAAERALATLATRIVALSPAQRRDLVHVYRIAPARKVVVVPPGLDLDGFRDARARHAGELRAELGIPPGTTVLGAVGRLVPVKAVEDILAAAAIVARARPVTLVIAGDGELRGDLGARARALGVDARFLGFRDDLPRVYAGFDLLLLGSKNEGTPLALIEAFAAGCPAVATAVGGVADVFGDAADGLLAPPGRPDLLAAAAIHLLADETRRRAWAEKARASAFARFGADALVARTAALYEELLASATSVS